MCDELMVQDLKPQLQPNLILAGMMGTGKSALGRQLAHRWQRPFLDTDDLIEKAEGMSVAEIFAKHGEDYFRQCEKKIMEEKIPSKGAIVACGGGLVVPPGMAELVRRKGIVVTLFASVETIVRRTSNKTHRPLLVGEDNEKKIRDLMQQREKAYLNAGIAVYTDGRSLQQLCLIVERVYEREIPTFVQAHPELWAKAD
ncbi:MAG: shikimate kinase [Verrucomicrobia bacterium]|nr:shikimate kinase [Verrucomicrobiota bacterium]